MRAFLLLALILPINANAKTRLDKWRGDVASVDIAGPVDVHLMAGRWGSAIPQILVKFSEDDTAPYLFQLDLGSDMMVLDAGVAKDLGFKVKTRNKKPIASLGTDEGEEKYRLGGKWRTAHADELILGEGLVLKGVEFFVAGALPDDDDIDPDQVLVPPVAGVIGVGALPLAAAILPSKGLVRFVPEAEGAQLLADLGGQTFPFTSLDSEFIKHALAGKQYFSPAKVVLDVTVAGQILPMRLDTNDYGNRVDETFQSGTATAVRVDDYDAWYVPFALGGLDLGSEWVLGDNRGMVIRDGEHGLLRYENLRGYDMAIDYVNGQFALAPATAQQRTPSMPMFLSMWETGLEKMLAEPPEDPDEAEAHTKKVAEQQIELGSLYREDGQTAKAVELTLKGVEADPDLCENWQALSWSHYYAGQYDEAVSAARKALDLYVGWSELPKDDRKKISKMKEDDLKEVATKPQDLDACYASAGYLALMELTRGNYGTVHETYKLYNDLHPLLPDMDGLALIYEGKLGAAEGPLRQAIKMATIHENSWLRGSARLALAHAFLANGDPAQALTIWEQEANYFVDNYFGVQMYADIAMAQKGQAGVVPALEALYQRYPDGVVIPVRLAAEQQALGQADQAAANLTKARVLLEEYISYQPEWSGLRAALAYTLYFQGDLVGARKLAEDVLVETPINAFAHYILALIDAAEGKMDSANAHYTRMKVLGVDEVGFFRLPPLPTPPQQEEPAPVPEPE